MGATALVLIDWENISKEILRAKIKPEKFSRAYALDQLFKWIKSEVDDIFDVFVFTPLFMAYTDYQLLHDHGLVPTTCPKVPLGSTVKKDTVDPILIEKGLRWITHLCLTHICLVSGDSDFMPLLRKAKESNLLVMISGTDPALAKDPLHPPMSKELINMADISPRTKQKMIHYFSPMIR